MSDDDNSYKQYEIREGVIFLIEMTPDILTPVPELGNKCQLYQILTSINDLMADMIVTMKSTGVGIYLYNLAPHEVYFKHALSRKNGLFKLFSLNQLNLANMKILNDLILDDIAKVRSITSVFKYEKPQKEEGLPQVLHKILDELMRKGQFNIKKCMWFTNNDNPFEEDMTAQNVRVVMDSFYRYGYTMQPIFLAKADNATFNMSKYQDIFLNTNYLKEEPSVGALTRSTGYSKDSSLFQNALLNEQIRSNILRVKEIKRIQFSCHLILSDGEGIGGRLGCSIKGYTVYSSETIKRDLKLRDGEEPLVPVHLQTKLVTAEGEDVDRKDIRKGYPISGNEIAVLDAKLVEFMTRYTFDHTQADLSSPQKFDKGDPVDFTSPAYLKLLGFRSIKNFTHVYNTLAPLFVTVDLEDGQGRQEGGGYSQSLKTFTSLYQSCVKLKKFAVLFGCPKRNTKPSLFALYPTKLGEADAELGEVGGDANNFPQGFLLIRMPWLDDIRPLPADFVNDTYNQQTVDEIRGDELLNKVSYMYKQLFSQFNVQSYIPSEYPNPSLNYFHKIIKHELLQIDLNPEDKKLEKNDFTTLKLNALRARLNEVDPSTEKDRIELIKILNQTLDEYALQFGPAEVEQEPPVKKQRVEVDEVDVIKAWRNDALSKFTVAQLKSFLQTQKCEVKVSKKSELIDILKKHLESGK